MYTKQSLKKTALKIPFRALGWPFSEMARPWFCIAPCLWYLCITQLILWPTRYSRRFPSMVPCTVNRQHIFGRRFVLSCYPNNQRNIIYIYCIYIHTHYIYIDAFYYRSLRMASQNCKKKFKEPESGAGRLRRCLGKNRWGQQCTKAVH